MFQTFDAVTEPALGPPRVAQLRALMRKLAVDIVLVPRADEHQGEYVPPDAERLAWLTGFSGSAGMAVIGLNFAALVTDGRYLLQGRAQLDAELFEIVDGTAGPWFDWAKKHARVGAVIGFDPKLHTAAAIKTLREDGAKHGFKLKPLTRNPVDAIWGRARPKPSAGPISIQPVALAGADAPEKIARVQDLLRSDKQDALVVTLPDSIAWLLNIRGSDVAHNPVPLCFAVVPQKGKVELYVASTKVSADVRAHLGAAVKLCKPEAFGARLAALKKAKGRRVRVDPATASDWIVVRLGKTAAHGTDPCIGFKARKTEAELDGTRTAHIRDGAAVCRFLAWLDAHAASGSVDEISAAEKLEAFRVATGALKDISFDTIAGAGPNGAIVHYRVNRASNRRLRNGELFLIDSGGQYLDGTTDITRTVAIGAPSKEMMHRFTLVLKGHIALAVARFPVGTRGVQLDVLARAPLWAEGLEFDHGTGHGVGSYLSVHEGPQSISKRGMAVLEPGMIISNEPGYYKTGVYGIRIENLVVVAAPQKIDGGDREMLSFETITLAPIDRRLIEVALLSAGERAWIDAYHARVHKVLSGKLSGADKNWLRDATQPLS